MSGLTNSGIRVLRGDLDPDTAAALAAEPRVACDIETSGLDWREASIGTIQIYSPTTGTVLLHQINRRPQRMLALLAQRSVCKVFHHAPFDLAFIVSHWRADIKNVNCTKIASKLAAPSAAHNSHSLAPLLLAKLDVKISKGPVRTSDWLSDELSDDQIDYAASDVRYLLDLLTVLREELQAARTLDLYESCCAFLPSQARLTTGGFPDVFSY